MDWTAMIGLGAIASVPSAAQADSLHFSFGDGVIGIQAGRYDNYDRYDRRDWRRTCSPGEALHKARRIGLRNARVVDVDRRTIDVVGRSRGDRVRVTFARTGNCRIVRM